VSSTSAAPSQIAILSLDTRGGVQPYIALALGLQRAGHRVHMIAPTDFVPLIESYDIWVSGLTGSVEAALRGAPGATEKGPLASIQFAKRESAKHVALWMREALDACDGVDVITGGIGGMIVGESVAERLGVPFVQTHLQPVCAPTGEYPGVLFPGVPRWMGAVGRRLSHTPSEFALWAPFSSAIRTARRDVLDLPPAKAPQRQSQPVLYGYSTQVVPRPSNWPDTRQVTGYWSLPHRDGWQPDAALVDFIRSGPPPICIGFGSMSSEDPAALTRLMTDVVHKLGVRAVLLSGWGSLSESPSHDLFVAREVPHDWLLPQMAAVVHHGGAGTTAAACTAGVPSLVIPFTMDQPFWASRIEALGVGPRAIPRKQLTADRLTSGIHEAISNQDIRRRATALGERIRREDGVGAAVAAFEAMRLVPV
jgi:sterol 3beta-glucosyltransferase